MAKDILKRLMRRADKMDKERADVEAAICEIAALRSRLEFVRGELVDTVGPIRHVLDQRKKTEDDGWKLLERVALVGILESINAIDGGEH
jgi:hypothetical protein